MSNIFINLLIISIIYLIFKIPNNFLFFISNFFIILINLYILLNNKNDYKLFLRIYLIFNLFTFGIIPLNDLNNQNNYWGGVELSVYTYIYPNFLILISLISVYYGYISSNLKLSYKFLTIYQDNFEFSFTKTILFYITLIIVFLYINNFDLSLILLRGVSSLSNEITETYSISETFLYGNILKSLPMVFFLQIYIIFRKDISFSKLLILFLISLFLCSPTSLPRYLIIVIYLPIILIYYKLLIKPFNLELFLLLCLLILFPFFDKFRNFNIENFTFKISLESINSGHFDSYQNFVRLVDSEIITYGNQLLGSILFFIPRIYWDNKPIGSGAYLANLNGLLFDNISMPLIGEGYINFGIIGIIIFMYLFGIFLSLLDNTFKFMQNEYKLSFFHLLYFHLIGLVIILLRGDLISGLASISAFLISFFVSILILKFLYKK